MMNEQNYQILASTDFIDFLKSQGLHIDSLKSLTQNLFEYLIVYHVKAWNRNTEPQQNIINKDFRKYKKDFSTQILEKLSLWFKEQEHTFRKITTIISPKEYEEIETLTIKAFTDPRSFASEPWIAYFDLYDQLCSRTGGFVQIVSRPEAILIIKRLVESRAKLHYQKSETSDVYPIFDLAIDFCIQKNFPEKSPPSIAASLDLTREAKLSDELSRIFKENFDRLDNIFSVPNTQLEASGCYIQRKYLERIFSYLRSQNYRALSHCLMVKTIMLLHSPIPRLQELGFSDHVKIIHAKNAMLECDKQLSTTGTYVEFIKILNATNDVVDICRYLQRVIKEVQRFSECVTEVNHRQVLQQLLLNGLYSDENDKPFKIMVDSVTAYHQNIRKQMALRANISAYDEKICLKLDQLQCFRGQMAIDIVKKLMDSLKEFSMQINDIKYLVNPDQLIIIKKDSSQIYIRIKENNFVLSFIKDKIYREIQHIREAFYDKI